MTNYTFQSLFDFTRTTSGTFVGSNGLIQTTPASVNLLLYTQDFDNAAWTKSNSTVTANAAVAPDGTSTADKLVEAATTSSHYVLRAATVTTAAHVFSVYAKAGERSFVSLGFDGLNVWFNLTTGAVGTIEAGLTAAIVSVGDGWYRCSAIRTVTVAGSKSSVIYSATADNALSYTGNGTSGIFIWGAQLETGSTATDYTRNNGGVYPARFDYDTATLQPKGILIEEQRVNLLTYSDQFDNAAWTKANATITANTTASPDGTTNADKLVEDTATSVHTVATGSITATANSFYAFTIYAKASGRDFIQINFSNLILSGNVWDVDLAANTITFVSAGAGWSNVAGSITNAGNGWRRISVSGQVGATISAVGVTVRLASSPSTISYTGNGTSGVLIWGAQMEAGAFATSYIPTVASQVTRTADQCTIVAPLFAPWYNQTQGTFVLGAITSPRAGSGTQEALINLTSTIRCARGAGSAAVGWFLGSASFMSSGVTTAITQVKTAGGYIAGNNAASTNGAAVTTDAGSTYGTPTQMDIGNILGGSFFNGHIRSIRYYPVRLADFQLQALTA